jgi:hypothetical protein
VLVDAAGNLWFCKGPGTWVKLAKVIETETQTRQRLDDGSDKPIIMHTHIRSAE